MEDHRGEFGPLSDKIIPIPIRTDLVVRFFGIPYDLTPAEAGKIINVVTALANADTSGHQLSPREDTTISSDPGSSCEPSGSGEPVDKARK